MSLRIISAVIMQLSTMQYHAIQGNMTLRQFDIKTIWQGSTWYSCSVWYFVIFAATSVIWISTFCDLYQKFELQFVIFPLVYLPPRRNCASRQFTVAWPRLESVSPLLRSLISTQEKFYTFLHYHHYIIHFNKKLLCNCCEIYVFSDVLEPSSQKRRRGHYGEKGGDGRGRGYFRGDFGFILN